MPDHQGEHAGKSGDALYMTASEAAAALNVGVATLYTYVSRKNLRVFRPSGARQSRYLRADIEQLKSGMSLAASRDGTPGLASSSAITLITDTGSYYRGVSAVALSDHATLEDTACLLWDCGADDPFALPAPAVPPHWKALFDATAEFDALVRLITLLPAIEAADVRAHDLSKAGFQRSGVNLLRWAAAILLNRITPVADPVHVCAAAAARCGKELGDIVRRVLVLAADQALEPTAYVVRAAANTGATPYRCIIAGLAAATGKRLAAVRIGSFTRFIAEIDAARDPVEPVRARIRESEDLPGFGFMFSPTATSDPRAVALWSALQQMLADDRRFGRFKAAVDAGMELTGLYPDFAFLAAWVMRRIGVRQHFDLIRLGRLVGWLAHGMEQQQDKPLIRWKLNYTGRLPS